MIVDTHCHLHFEQFDSDRQDVIRRAQEAGVRYLINVGTDPENNAKACELASKYPFMKHTAGLHPHSSHEIDEEGLKKLEKTARETGPAAIGEIGLDYFKSEADPATQKKVFARMISIALENNLPVIVHSRNAFEDTYEMLKSEGRRKLRGVMHCYSYDTPSLKKLMDLGFLASFTCNVTYKSAQSLLQVLLDAPLDHVMLETDSPYLSPQTRRGQRNEPAHLKELVSFVAQRKGIRPEEFAAQTSKNAVRFFSL